MFYVYADGESIHVPLLKDHIIVKPKLSIEMGKAGSFEFGIPPTHLFYDSLQKLKTIITVNYDDVEVFRGRVLTINRGFNNIKKVYCEGNLAYLVDSVQKGEKYKGKVHDLFRKIITNHNKRVESTKQFTVGNITIDNRDIVITGSSTEMETYETKKFKYEQIAIDSMVNEWSTTFDYIQETIIDNCGGYLRTRRVGNTTYIDLLKDYGNTAMQSIEFGRNLIDLTEEVKAEDLYTVLIPIGDDNLTIKKVNNGSDELVDQAGVELYGRIVKTHVFDGVNKASTLLEDARRMLNNHENMPITFTVKAIDMHLLGTGDDIIKVGDRVQLNSSPHGIVEYLTCTKIEYDLENHANDTYTFGNPKQSLTERYKKDKAKSKRARKSSGSKGSAGASTAAQQDTEDLVTETVEDAKQKIYDAWIDVDPDAGKVTLGAIHNQIINGKEYLKTKVGIDMDADKGTVDIYAMNNQLTTHGAQIGENSSKIQLVANDLESSIKSSAEWRKGAIESISTISQRVDDDEARIDELVTYKNATSEGLAQTVSWVNANQATILQTVKYVGDNKKNINTIATIEQTANAAAAFIDIQAKYNKGNDEKVAQIKAQADKNGSSITLKADKVYVDTEVLKVTKRIEAAEAVINSIKTEFLVSGRLKVTGQATFNSPVEVNGNINAKGYQIRAKSIYMGDSSDLVATQKWVNTTALPNISNTSVTTTKLSVTGSSVSTMACPLRVSSNVTANNFYMGTGTKTYKVATEKWVNDGIDVGSLKVNGKTVATQEWVNGKLGGDLSIKSLLVSNSVTFKCDVSMTKNTLRANRLLMDGKTVATQEWVNKKLEKYASSTHTHTVKIGHTHKVTVGSVQYGTTGANPAEKTTGGPN